MIHNSFPRGFASGSKDGLMSAEDKAYLSFLRDNIGQMNDNIDEALRLSNIAYTAAMDTTAARVFNTKADLDAWIAIEENITNLKIGTTLFIKDTETPDYWWDGETIQILETQKVDLVEYVKKTDNINTNTVNFSTDEELKEITSGSTMKTLFGTVSKAVSNLISLISKVGDTDISDSGKSITEAINNISTSYLKLSGGELTGQLKSQDIIPSSGGTYNLGSDSNAYANIYAARQYLYSGGINYGRIGIDTVGTTDTTGASSLVLGTNKATGTAGNAKGVIHLYGTSTGFTSIYAGNNTISNISITLPSIGGTLALTSDTVAKATQLETKRTITTNLASTDAAEFDGTGNVTPGVTGVLPAANGGTGKTSLTDAANALINSLSVGSSTPTDNDYYVAQYAAGGTTTTTYHRKPLSALYSYIEGKTDKVYLKLSGGELEGNIIQKNLTLTDGVNSRTVVTIYDDGDDANNGSELIIGAAGNTFIGSGESASSLRTTLQAGTLVTNEVYTQTGESMFVSSDGAIFFVVNCQTIANRLAAKLDASGNFITPGYLKSASKVYGGDKAELWTDTEGGNLRLTSPGGKRWSIDALNNTALRFIYEESAVPFTFSSDGVITATSFSGTATKANWLNTNSGLTYGASGLQYFNANVSATSGAKANTVPVASNWAHIIRMNHANNDGYFADLALPLNSDIGMHYRVIMAGSENITWRKLLDSSNYSSYSAFKSAITGPSFGVDGTMNIVAERSNEVNFGGTNNSGVIYFGYRASGSKPIPTKFVFGSSTGTAAIQAATYNGYTLGAACAKAVATAVTSGSTALVTSGAVYTEINTLKNSVSDGKKTVANAITAKGVTTATDASFATMATNIGKIQTAAFKYPTAISTFSASGYDKSLTVSFSWALPSDTSRCGVRIVYSTSSAPTSATSGTLIYDSNSYTGTTTTSCSFTFPSLTTYYISIFTYTYVNNTRYYSSAKSISFKIALVQGYKKFTSSGTFTVPSGVSYVDVFLVGGGNKGGDYSYSSAGPYQSYYYGGTGGRGGYYYTVKKIAVTAGSSITVTVGAANNGASKFGSYSSASGTAGAAGGAGASYYNSPGGSSTTNAKAGSAGVYAFGDSAWSSSYDSSIRYCAGGGGGDAYGGYGTAGAGGTTGGGKGGENSNGSAGTANTGSGGGGASYSKNPGNGGSGCVIVRYGYS